MMAKCNHSNSIVKDSRKVDGVINRTRVCKDCGLRFYTTETLSGDNSIPKLNKKVEQLEDKLFQIERIIGGR